MRVELLNIGTELLMGFVVNTHASWIGRRLNGIGATLTRQVCVTDTGEEIRAALGEAMGRAEVVITTGGLGPTSDDITRTAVVEMLGLPTRVDEKVLDNIRERFRKRGTPMPESTKAQAVVPVAATVLPNANGTAPGLAIPAPVSLHSAAPSSHPSPPARGRRSPRGSSAVPSALVETGLAHGFPRPDSCRGEGQGEGFCRMIIMLPGPPRELHPMFEQQVLPLLRERFADLLPVIECRVLRVAGLGESRVEEMVESRLRAVEGLEVGYCARPGEVDLRLVTRAKEASVARRSADRAERIAREILGEAVFGQGEDTLEQAVVGLLRRGHATLSTAESCTGGYLAHRITLVSGSSECFKQGWVTYSNDAKATQLGVPGHLIVEHGAVSEPVARAMAEGARARAATTWGLAVTGIAGPAGGTPEKPVGTVFIALAGPAGVTCSRHLFVLDRESFKFITAQTAMNMLRLEAGKQG